MQHLGVRGVERGEEDRVEEVDVAEVAGLHEPRRERHVVPEAVGPVHARGERPQGRHHPGGGERGAGEHGDHAGEPPGRWRGGRRGRPQGPAVGQPGGEEARGQASGHQGAQHDALLEQTEGPQRLADPDQARHRQHRLGQPRGGPRPARQQQGTHPVGAEGQRRQHHDELQGAAQVRADRERALTRRRGEESRAHRDGSALTPRSRTRRLRGSRRSSYLSRPRIT